MLADSLSLPLTMFTALADRTDLLMVLTDRAGRIEWPIKHLLNAQVWQLIC